MPLVVLSAIAVGASTYSGVKQIQASRAAATAEEQAAESQAQLDEYNATVAEQQAVDAEQRGEQAVQRLGQEVKQVIGSQRAGLAAGNVDITTGSAAEVQADAAYLGRVDQATARNNAAREAWGYRVQKEDLLKQAEITRRTGKYQAAATRAQGLAGGVGAIGSGIVTGVSLLGKKYGFAGGD